jgi:glycosyltransferase involved in cell wall biosynthesis
VAAADLSHVVTYLGPKYGEAKAACLAAADIFAFPTFYHFECFPLVILEAMQAGLPVVSTYEGGIRDAVQEGGNGILCPQGDARSLADALKRLIGDDNLRAEMGRAGRERFENEFTLERFEHRLTQILGELAGQCSLRHDVVNAERL